MRSLAAAVSYFTRIPLPSTLVLQAEDHRHSQTFFPLIGWPIGLSQAGVFYLAAQAFPPLVATILAIAWAILLTGGLHEDGLADCADGFGGGHGREQVLRIMRDPSIGTFGMMTLLLAFAVKVSILSQLAIDQVIIAFFVAAPLSRLVASCLSWLLPYAQRCKDTSTTKRTVADQRLSWGRRSFQLLFGLLPFVILNPKLSLLIAASQLLLLWISQLYVKARLGGYTGDCLGALQQLSEIVLLLITSIWAKYYGIA